MAGPTRFQPGRFQADRFQIDTGVVEPVVEAPAGGGRKRRRPTGGYLQTQKPIELHPKPAVEELELDEADAISLFEGGEYLLLYPKKRDRRARDDDLLLLMEA